MVQVFVRSPKTGQKKVLGFNFGETESLDRWKELLHSLKKRGLNNVNLFITDGLSGMPTAIREIYPNARHQKDVQFIIREI